MPEAAVDALGDLLQGPGAHRHADQVLPRVAELLDDVLAGLDASQGDSQLVDRDGPLEADLQQRAARKVDAVAKARPGT